MSISGKDERMLAPVPEARQASSLAALKARFARDDQGAVAMIFGIAFIPCVMMVGLAIDYGRMTLVVHQTQNVLDAAALAASRAYQTSSGDQIADATTARNSYWNASTSMADGATTGTLRHAIKNSATHVEPDYDETDATLTLQVSQWVQTPFMSVAQLMVSNPADSSAPAGICKESSWNCRKVTTRSTVKMMETNGTSDETLEIAMMLDVTGSMDWSVTGSSTKKIDDLKVAAKDLVDIILPSGKNNLNTRIAMIPFSEAVYPGTYAGENIASWAQGPIASGTCNTDVKGCEYFTFHNSLTTNRNPRTTTYKASTKCSIARTATDKWTDDAPGGNSYVDLYYPSTDGNCSLVDADDSEINQIVPLTNDGDLLRTRLAKMKHGGYTAGHIGTQWTWYMLSPNWGTPYPAANRPKAYDTKVRKVAILMTDGQYNTQYCKGVVSKDSYAGWGDFRTFINCNGDGTTSDKLAESLCAKMKAKDIIVYTIGFDVDSNNDAKKLLRDCATTTAHFYNATSTAAIRTAFQDIALKVATQKLIVSK